MKIKKFQQKVNSQNSIKGVSEGEEPAARE